MQKVFLKAYRAELHDSMSSNLGDIEEKVWEQKWGLFDCSEITQRYIEVIAIIAGVSAETGC